MRILPVSREIKINENIVIGGSDGSHIARVMRLNKGDFVRLYTPSGRVFSAVIENVYKNDVALVVRSKESDIKPPVKRVTVAQGVLKSDKFEWMLQKSCELGVSKIIPFISNRTVARPDESKLKRWERIITEASKQSGNPYPPRLDAIVPFKNIIRRIPSEALKILFSEEEGWKLKAAIENEWEQKEIAVIIGPEGGFEREEVEFAKKNDCRIVNLGWRILRGETAAVVAVSIIQYHLGEF